MNWARSKTAASDSKIVEEDQASLTLRLLSLQVSTEVINFFKKATAQNISKNRDKGEVTPGTSWLLTETKLVEPTWSGWEVLYQNPMIQLQPSRNILHHSYIFPGFSFLLCRGVTSQGLTQQDFD